MNSEDTLYGRVKNGVLTLSGNNASIRVDGGHLVVSDGPTQVPPDHRGPAPSLAQRMVTGRFRRAGCPINRVVVTRPDGFITFAAVSLNRRARREKVLCSCRCKSCLGNCRCTPVAAEAAGRVTEPPKLSGHRPTRGGSASQRAATRVKPEQASKVKS